MVRPTAKTYPIADHGQVVPIMAAIIVLVAALGLGIARYGALVVNRARAQNAADAAALAAAQQIDPVVARRAARRVARSNGATVVAFDHRGAVVVVEVDVHHAHAIAAARPVAPLPGVDP